jgi:3D (Asp-Asp-Asp) domain-containing protein
MSAWSPGIAVDPNAIPYGTSLSVPGYDRATWAPADDTGNFVKRRRKNPEVVYIDVRMKTHQQARDWGTQYLVIKVRKNCD